MFMIPHLKGGGAERVLIDLLSRLDQSKFDITLIVLQHQGVYLEQIPAGIKVQYLMKGPAWMYWLQSRIIKYFRKWYYRLMIKEQYDVEVAFLEGMATNLIAHSHNKASRKIAWIHTDMHKNHWTKNMFYLGDEERCYRRFDELIFVSNDSVAAFRERFKQVDVSLKVIPNPVIPEQIIKKAKAFEVNYPRQTIVTIGRLNPQKGFDLLIQAFAKISERFDVDLVIVGEGPQRAELEKLIDTLQLSHCVKLLGYQENPYPYMKAADIFMSSSRTEGYPIVLLEALVLNKAIIATKITGNQEILNDGEAGLMCDCTIEGMVEAISQILDGNCSISMLEAQSAKRAAQFDIDEILHQIESIL